MLLVVVPWTEFGAEFDAALAQSFWSTKCSGTPRPL